MWTSYCEKTLTSPYAHKLKTAHTLRMEKLDANEGTHLLREIAKIMPGDTTTHH
jgi:hypothetical protein